MSNTSSGFPSAADAQERPGDDAPAGTPGTGENLCPHCNGVGHDVAGKPCPVCDGTGKVVSGIGGG